MKRGGRCLFRRGILTAAFIPLFSGSALAGQPSDQLRPGIERVIKVLEDPGLKGDTKTKKRRDTIRNITSPLFNWTDMARRALGRHWPKRTEAEREEFVRLFRDLIERAYISTIERYSGEPIGYAGDSVEGDHATVRTKFHAKQGREVPIDYRLSRWGERWLIYDVAIGGLSLVQNYRAQFDEIIQTASYQDLVVRMKSQRLAKRAP